MHRNTTPLFLPCTILGGTILLFLLWHSWYCFPRSILFHSHLRVYFSATENGAVKATAEDDTVEANEMESDKPMSNEEDSDDADDYEDDEDDEDQEELSKIGGKENPQFDVCKK